MSIAFKDFKHGMRVLVSTVDDLLESGDIVEAVYDTPGELLQMTKDGDAQWYVCTNCPELDGEEPDEDQFFAWDYSWVMTSQRQLESELIIMPFEPKGRNE